MKTTFDQIKFRKPSKKLKRQKNHPVNGIDTETFDGKVILIADNNQRYLEPENFSDLLNFLTYRRYKNSFNFFYNLRYDVQAILKWLLYEKDGDKYLKNLYFDGKIDYNDYKIHYIPKKVFKIRNSHRESFIFYDLAQFFNISLEEASRKFLDKKKYQDEYENIDREKIGEEKGYYEKHRKEIIKYCINDAVLTSELGDFLQQMFKREIKFIPQSYISKADISKQYFKFKIDIPTFFDVKRDIQKFAYYSYHGGRFEVIKRGNLGYCTLIDINSAYPHAIANLPDIRKGKWKKTNEFNEEALIGFYLAHIIVKPEDITPLPLTFKNGTKIFPCGEWITYITHAELKAFKKEIKFEILDGWEFHSPEPEYPFREEILKLYKWRKSIPKDNPVNLLIKIIMNSLYGSFYELTKIPNKGYLMGHLFNPVYASYITALTRIQLFKKAREIGFNRIAGFATDSILIEGEWEENNNELGEWSVDRSGKTIVLKSGIYEVGKKLKERGVMKKAGKIVTKKGQFNSIFDYMRAYPHYEKYEIILKKPLNLSEAILHHQKWNLHDLNKFVEIKYQITLKENKRIWDKQPETGEDILYNRYNSMPFIIKAEDFNNIIPKTFIGDYINQSILEDYSFIFINTNQ